mmetsp:Transcript_10019/g.40646  ORF Transcript_10019/g.40646 Transcript_10019/m.40646 type:complete len:560 (+) Transcript_10019:938-2617(+)
MPARHRVLARWFVEVSRRRDRSDDHRRAHRRAGRVRDRALWHGARARQADAAGRRASYVFGGHLHGALPGRGARVLGSRSGEIAPPGRRRRLGGPTTRTPHRGRRLGRRLRASLGTVPSAAANTTRYTRHTGGSSRRLPSTRRVTTKISLFISSFHRRRRRRRELLEPRALDELALVAVAEVRRVGGHRWLLLLLFPFRGDSFTTIGEEEEVVVSSRRCVRSGDDVVRGGVLPMHPPQDAPSFESAVFPARLGAPQRLAALLGQQRREEHGARGRLDRLQRRHEIKEVDAIVGRRVGHDEGADGVLDARRGPFSFGEDDFVKVRRDLDDGRRRAERAAVASEKQRAGDDEGLRDVLVPDDVARKLFEARPQVPVELRVLRRDVEQRKRVAESAPRDARVVGRGREVATVEARVLEILQAVPAPLWNHRRLAEPLARPRLGNRFVLLRVDRRRRQALDDPLRVARAVVEGHDEGVGGADEGGLWEAVAQRRMPNDGTREQLRVVVVPVVVGVLPRRQRRRGHRRGADQGPDQGGRRPGRPAAPAAPQKDPSHHDPQLCGV